jgi:hypothetical protein
MVLFCIRRNCGSTINPSSNTSRTVYSNYPEQVPSLVIAICPMLCFLDTSNKWTWDNQGTRDSILPNVFSLSRLTRSPIDADC